MNYIVEIEVMSSVSYTVNTASCKEHAEQLAIEMFKQDYPDLNFYITNCEEDDEDVE